VIGWATMRVYRICLLVACLAVSSALAPAQTPATIILVRHAEKTAPTGDVSISDLGRTRAAALAHVVADLNIRSVCTNISAHHGLWYVKYILTKI
jgi:hypothetical protein